MLSILRFLFAHERCTLTSEESDVALLSAESEEVLEELSVVVSSSDDVRQQLIDRALRKLECDLQSCQSPEVIEEVRREIAYRLWCADARI